MHVISYSRTDGLDFALWLYDSLIGDRPSIRVWLDKDDLSVGESWDVQIEEALRTAETVLYVMTLDSVDQQSVSWHELMLAQRYSKPIIPLRVDPTVTPPLPIVHFSYIDFSHDRAEGLARLRKLLRSRAQDVRLATPRPPGTEKAGAPRLDLAQKRVFISYSHRDTKPFVSSLTLWW